MEIVHVVAINPYRKGNKGKVFSYNIDTYDKVIESAAVKKMIQQIRGELPIDGVDLNDAQAVQFRRKCLWQCLLYLHLCSVHSLQV